MEHNKASWPDTTRLLEWVEPITPVLLAAHGALLLRDTPSTPLQWMLVALTSILGFAGLAGWRSHSAMTIRAWTLLGLAWMLLYLSGGVTSFFTLWFFMLVAVYPLALGGKTSAAYPVIMGLAYLALAPLSDSRLAHAVLFGRAAVIMAIGLVVAGIAASQHRAARELARAKDEFVATISHELRTPLTAVVGFATELHERARELETAEIEEFAGQVHRHSIDVANIVEDLLVIARSEGGKVSVQPMPLDLRVELEKVVDGLRPLYPATDELITILGSTTLASADPARVRQILRNLITNAFRYGGSRIEARLTTDGNRISIELADNGDGIPEKYLTRIFTPYGRFHVGEGNPNSTGLGLAVSRTLARLMGGELTYYRREGWTVFRLELPASQSVPVDAPH